MATRISKPVRREMFVNKGLFIVTLHPDSTISFREKGKRTRYACHLNAAFNCAIISFVQDDFDERMNKYEEKKKYGVKRLRRPKKPNLTGIFSKQYQVAIKNSKT